MSQRIAERFSSPSMVLAFISATFGIMNFAAACMNLEADSLFAIGIIRLLLGFVLFCGALINLLKGNPLGNLNLIFSVCFGLFSGSNLMITVYNRSMHIAMQPLIYGILQIMAGCFVGGLLPVLKKIPFYQWLSSFCSVAGLFLFGLSDVTSWKILSWCGGWFFLLFCFLSIYTGLSAINPGMPQGKSLEQMLKKN